MYREPTVMGRKQTQINSLDRKEEISIQLEENEQRIFLKNAERLRNLQDNFQRSNTQITRVPEGEKEQQETENLFEKIMENLPNLAKEVDFQEVQEAQSPKKVGPMEGHTKAHHNYITQDYS